jgi:hypothetical protein
VILNIVRNLGLIDDIEAKEDDISTFEPDPEE